MQFEGKIQTWKYWKITKKNRNSKKLGRIMSKYGCIQGKCNSFAISGAQGWIFGNFWLKRVGGTGPPPPSQPGEGVGNPPHHLPRDWRTSHRSLATTEGLSPAVEAAAGGRRPAPAPAPRTAALGGRHRQGGCRSSPKSLPQQPTGLQTLINMFCQKA